MTKHRTAAFFLAGALALSGAAVLPAEHCPVMISVSAENTEKLPAPDDIKAAPTDSSVKLSWNAVEGACGYRVYMLDEESGEYRIYKNVKGTACTVKELECDKEYRFMIAAAAKENGKVRTQTKTGALLVNTCTKGSFTSDRQPGHLNNDFIENAGGKGHKKVLKKCGIGNYSYDAEARCADGYVMYAGTECELLLYFNEKDQLTNFLIAMPSDKDIFEQFSESLLNEGYEKYYNDEIGTDIFRITYNRDIMSYFYDEENSSIIMIYVFLDYYGK